MFRLLGVVWLIQSSQAEVADRSVRREVPLDTEHAAPPVRRGPRLGNARLSRQASGVSHESKTERDQEIADLKASYMNEHKQKWIFAFQTCAVSKYVQQLEGQMRTWAADVPHDNMLIIGGPHDNGEGKLACDEGPRGQNCKEATVLYRASQRAEEVGADWLFHVIDDAYVFLPRVYKAMDEFDPSEPLVFANFGCGRAWQYHEESKGGTLARPHGWTEPTYHCEKAWREGGICTAAGYIVSRGALKLLRRNHTLASFVKHYTQLSVGRASDISTTCLFYDRGIKVQKWPRNLQMASTTHGLRPDSIVNNKNFGSVHVAFTDHAKIPVFMDELHKSEEGI